MELILSNHSSFPRIGDHADLQVLRKTIGQFEKGQKNQADLRAAEDRMTELALGEQIQAGLDVVTDGQIRWYDSVSHLAAKLSGARINGLLRFFDTNCYFRQPVVEARIERTGPMVVEEFEFARRKSSRPVKAVLTGPLTLARHSIVTNGASAGGAVNQKLVEEYMEALAEEVAALATVGAPFIQIEEPVLLRHPEDLPLARRCLEAFSARKGAAQLALVHAARRDREAERLAIEDDTEIPACTEHPTARVKAAADRGQFSRDVRCGRRWHQPAVS